MSEPKVVMITGSNSSLGRCFIRMYAEEYKIIGVSRTTPAIRDDTYHFIKANVNHPEIMEEVIAVHGTVDVLINNAVFRDHVPLIRKTSKNFRKEVRTGLVTPLMLSNTLIESVWGKDGKSENKLRNRSIVNISSIAGVNVYGPRGLGTYSAYKAGLNMLTRHMALEYFDEYGIRVNAVAPNTFPNIVSTESVCSGIRTLIEGESNGLIAVLDKSVNR